MKTFNRYSYQDLEEALCVLWIFGKPFIHPLVMERMVELSPVLMELWRHGTEGKEGFGLGKYTVEAPCSTGDNTPNR